MEADMKWELLKDWLVAREKIAEVYRYLSPDRKSMDKQNLELATYRQVLQMVDRIDKFMDKDKVA